MNAMMNMPTPLRTLTVCRDMGKHLPLLVVWMLCQLGMALIGLRMLYAVATAPDRAWKIALAVDEAGNVAGNGQLGQTISARAAQARNEGRRWGCVLCRWLDRLDAGHCDRALEDAEQNLKE